jgi:hypothetical protein
MTAQISRELSSYLLGSWIYEGNEWLKAKFIFPHQYWEAALDFYELGKSVAEKYSDMDDPDTVLFNVFDNIMSTLRDKGDTELMFGLLETTLVDQCGIEQEDYDFLIGLSKDLAIFHYSKIAQDNLSLETHDIVHHKLWGAYALGTGRNPHKLPPEDPVLTKYLETTIVFDTDRGLWIDRHIRTYDPMIYDFLNIYYSFGKAVPDDPHLQVEYDKVVLNLLQNAKNAALQHRELDMDRVNYVLKMQTSLGDDVYMSLVDMVVPVAAEIFRYLVEHHHILADVEEKLIGAYMIGSRRAQDLLMHPSFNGNLLRVNLN